MIEIKVFETQQEIAAYAGEVYKKLINEKPHAVLGLATGSSPISLYKRLIELNQAKEIDFSNVVTVNLDEYVGIESTHSQSYRYFMNEQLFNHINISKENTHVPNGQTQDLEHACHEYEEIIDQVGPFDIQLLGVGVNGHIGFNEPSLTLNSLTHIEDLKTSTLEANARFFDSIEQVPTKAITMGLGPIMKSKQVILIATGESKANAIKALTTGIIDPQCPVSFLQLHPNVLVLLDTAAAKYV